MIHLFEALFGHVQREVEEIIREENTMRKVSLKRDYATNSEDLWDALTNPGRLQNWFLPVSGELAPGGHYALKGNASGEILTCDAPKHFSLTWIFGDNVSYVDVTITAITPETSRLQLSHTMTKDDHWDQFGPGATGVGWELGFLGLDTHLGFQDKRFAEASWMETDECKQLMRQSSEAWKDAHIVSGEDPSIANSQHLRTAGFFTGEGTS